jgi:hypothetical protein
MKRMIVVRGIAQSPSNPLVWGWQDLGPTPARLQSQREGKQVAIGARDPVPLPVDIARVPVPTSPASDIDSGALLPTI